MRQNMRIVLQALYSKVMVIFAVCLGLPCFFMNSQCTKKVTTPQTTPHQKLLCYLLRLVLCKFGAFHYKPGQSSKANPRVVI